MNRFGIAAVLVLALVLLGSAAAARPQGKNPGLDPALARRLAAAGPNTPLQVVVVLDRQASIDENQNQTGQHGSREKDVVEKLHQVARDAQRPLLDLLSRREGEGRVSAVSSLWIFDGLVVTATPDVVRELAARTDVREIRLSRTLRAADALATGPPEPNVSRVRAPDLWSLGNRGQGVVVASMDTGVDASHPDLSASWRGGSNSWYDPYGEHPTTPADVNGHGTWTTGVMVGGDAGGTSIGVAPGAKWIAVKIFNDHGTATTAAIHQGFQWLLDPDGNPSTGDAPAVVNGSWTMGAPGCDLEFQLDLRALRAAGILPVFAAGNGGPGAGSSYSPANNPEALSVGGVDNADVVDPASSRGPSACDGGVFPKVVAPDISIRTSDLYGGYVSETGTSMAAPEVAGALALLLSRFPDTPPVRQEAALEAGAVDLGTPGPDPETGYGRLDALAAYNWLAAAPDFTVAAPVATASTTPGGSVSYQVDVGSVNGFAGSVTFSLAGLTAAQASWTFTPAAVTGSGTAQLAVTTASTLAPGSYALTIAGTDGTTTHRAGVTLQVTAPPNFTLTASPQSAGTLAGGAVAYSVNVGSLFGFAGSVSLSLGGLTPSQATWSFTPASLTGSGSSTLKVTTLASLAPGTYPLTITGSSGSISHSAGVTLVVTAAPDFGISVSPASASVVHAQSVSYTVSVSAIGGFAGKVTLSAAGLPSGATATFAPNPVTAPGSATMTVRTQSFTTRGTFTIRISGKSGTVTRQTTAALTVR